MKAHKTWSIGAFVCMSAAAATAFCEESKKAHKCLGIASLACMAMSIYSGHMVTHGGGMSVEEMRKEIFEDAVEDDLEELEEIEEMEEMEDLSVATEFEIDAQ